MTPMTIDTHDCEIIAWVSVCCTGISGSDVRDTMLQAVEKRFADARVLHSIEHLSANGSPYTAPETRNFTIALNLAPCFTPVARPQSNGATPV